VSAALPPGAQAVLAADPGVAVEAGPVYDSVRQELVWRVRATDPGRHRLALAGPGLGADLAVPVAVAGLPALTSARHASALDQTIFDPAGASLPAKGALRRFAVTLPDRQVAVLGVRWPWIVTFSVLSLAAGLLLRSALRVEL
jgi:hypothetical protein